MYVTMCQSMGDAKENKEKENEIIIIKNLMLKNYFTITIRNLKRNLSYSVINVFGLALGITCSMVLFLMITFYTSYDSFHDNKERIYRVVNVHPIIMVELIILQVCRYHFLTRSEMNFTGIEHVLFISGGL